METVAVSDNTIVVGAGLDDDNGFNAGSANVFERQAGSWVEVAKLMPSDPAPGDFLGALVAASGNTVVVWAHQDDDQDLVDSGSAYVFERVGNSWVDTTKLTASDGATGDFFRVSLTVSGNVLAVGALGHDGGDLASSGATYVFERLGGVWVEVAKLTAGDAATGDTFSGSVAASRNTLLVGARGDHLGNPGSAHVFQ